MCMHEGLGLILELHNQVWGVERGVSSDLWLHGEFEVSLGYLRLCVKQTKTVKLMVAKACDPRNQEAEARGLTQFNANLGSCDSSPSCVPLPS